LLGKFPNSQVDSRIPKILGKFPSSGNTGDAEGVEGEGNVEGTSPPQATRGCGERRELPQRGLGRRPKTSFGVFTIYSLKNTPDSHKSVIFDISETYI